jgi:hypothetical protein
MALVPASARNLPAAQFVQVVFATVSLAEYFPATQTRQSILFGVYFPLAQNRQPLAPSVISGEYFPASQLTQEWESGEATKLAYFPAAQIEQPASPWVPVLDATLPLGHEVQVAAPASEYLPMTHETQSLALSAPVESMCFPAGQLIQSPILSWLEAREASWGLYVPLGHAKQSLLLDPAVVKYLPSVQTWQPTDAVPDQDPFAQVSQSLELSCSAAETLLSDIYLPPGQLEHDD